MTLPSLEDFSFFFFFFFLHLNEVTIKLGTCECLICNVQLLHLLVKEFSIFFSQVWCQSLVSTSSLSV